MGNQRLGVTEIVGDVDDAELAQHIEGFVLAPRDIE